MLSNEESRKALFKKLFQDNKLAEYHLKRKIFEKLADSQLCGCNSFIDITIIKEQSLGTITCKLKVVKKGERTKSIFKIHLNHQFDSTLKIQEFLFSTFCSNIEIEKEIYRYIAIIAMEAGYTSLHPSDIVYEINDEFDFSKPDINDLFPFLAYLRHMDSIEELTKQENKDDILKFLQLVPIVKFNLNNLISYESVIDIREIILKTNNELSEVQKNYLIKMARKLFCILNRCEEHRYRFKGQCVLLSQVVFFLATEKLNIPKENNTILDGLMDGMGAHTVALIKGRYVDSTSDQFQIDGHVLNPYEDNSLYFNYSQCSPSDYDPSMIEQYIKLFRMRFKNVSIEEFLRSEDESLYNKSIGVQVFS